MSSSQSVDVAELYRTNRDKIYRVCLRMTGNPATAEDLTQDTFVQAVRFQHKFRGDSRPSTWLYRIAVNCVLMKLRPRLSNIERRTDPSPIADGAVARKYTDPLANVDLGRAIAQLPKGQRNIFIRHEIIGQTEREIATRMEVNIGTVKSQLHKAKRSLKSLLTTGEKHENTNRSTGT